MSHILKYASYGLGGLALIIGSFVMYSVLTGTPMNKMKAVGGMFPEQVAIEAAGGEGTELPDAEEEMDSDRRSPRQIYETASSSLGAFALQDPFSADELRDLEKRLQRGIDENARRANELDERERRLEEDRQHLEDLYADFHSLRTRLLEESAETEAAAAEVDRDRGVLQEREALSYKRMATLFEDTKADEAAQLMTAVYGPEEAARILVQLDDDRVSELITAIHELIPNESARYVKALQAARAKQK